MREITPRAIRNPTLKRRLRGYDPEDTKEFLAEVAESYDEIHAHCVALAEELANTRHEHQEREMRARGDVDRLNQQLKERGASIADLEARLKRFEKEESERLGELDRLRKELSAAQEAQEAHDADLLEQRERVARLGIREKALLEQISMLGSQFERDEERLVLRGDQRALPRGADRAAILTRLDRVTETLMRETRREAEVTLKKARERADEILRSAEARRQRLEAETAGPGAADESEGNDYDPVAALERIQRPEREREVLDPLERGIGEAAWTSRAAFNDIPEPSR